MVIFKHIKCNEKPTQERLYVLLRALRIKLRLLFELTTTDFSIIVNTWVYYNAWVIQRFIFNVSSTKSFLKKKIKSVVFK